MVELINSMTGTRMLVAEDRETEYLAAGHRPVQNRKKKEPAGEDGSSASLEAEITEEKARQEPAPQESTRTTAKTTGTAPKKKTAASAVSKKTAAKK